MPRNFPVDPPAPTSPDTVWVAWQHDDGGPRIVAIAADELTARRSAMKLIVQSPHVTEVPLDGSEVFDHLESADTKAIRESKIDFDLTPPKLRMTTADGSQGVYDGPVPPTHGGIEDLGLDQSKPDPKA